MTMENMIAINSVWCHPQSLSMPTSKPHHQLHTLHYSRKILPPDTFKETLIRLCCWPFAIIIGMRCWKLHQIIEMRQWLFQLPANQFLKGWILQLSAMKSKQCKRQCFIRLHQHLSRTANVYQEETFVLGKSICLAMFEKGSQNLSVCFLNSSLVKHLLLMVIALCNLKTKPGVVGEQFCFQ